MVGIFNEFFVTKIYDIQCLLSTWESPTTTIACQALNSLLTASKSKLQIFKPTTVSEIIRQQQFASPQKPWTIFLLTFCVIVCLALLQKLLHILLVLVFCIAHFLWMAS